MELLDIIDRIFTSIVECGYVSAESHGDVIARASEIMRCLPEISVIEHCLFTEVIGREQPFRPGEVSVDDVTALLSRIDYSDLQLAVKSIERIFDVHILKTTRMMEMRCPKELVSSELKALGKMEDDPDLIKKIQTHVFYNYNHSVSTKTQISKACSEIEDEFMLSLMGI
jgi:hypothetical protein